MQTFCFFAVRLMRRFFGRITAEVTYALAIRDLRHPRFFLEVRRITHALHAMLVRRFAVGSVLSVRRQSEIDEAVVIADTITMIDLLARPSTGHESPRKTVLCVGGPFDLYMTAPPVVTGACTLTDMYLRSWRPPSKMTCDWVVVKDLFQATQRWHMSIISRSGIALQGVC